MTDQTAWYSRYSRQLLIEGFDESHQQRLQKANVAIIGMGGLGCHVAIHLAGSGTGRLTLIDPDSVALSNLPRQPLYREVDCGKPKVHCASARLKENNSQCDIVSLQQCIEDGGLVDVFEHTDLIIDCTDNTQARLHVSRQARHHQKPLFSAAATGFQAHVIAFHWAQDASCYGCLHALDATPETSCLSHGIMGPVVAIAGLYQALMAVNFLTGLYMPSWGTLMQFCGASLRWKHLQLPQAQDCTICWNK